MGSGWQGGRIALDDPIQRYLPSFDTQGHTVTIHHLLNHTSGIRSYTKIDGAGTREAVLDTIQKHAYDFAPGEQFLYNNSGYYLLGVILEAVTDMSYAQYLQERLFEPLGMESTSYCGYEGREVPVGYAVGDDGLTTTRVPDMASPYAAGGLCSTVDDLLTWQRAIVTGDVVRADSYARMTTPASLESGEPLTYGYGLLVGELEGQRRIAHGGGIEGYHVSLVLPGRQCRHRRAGQHVAGSYGAHRGRGCAGGAGVATERCFGSAADAG